MVPGPRKRKRTAEAIPNLPTHLPPESINPLSHKPSTLRQFAVAGLAEHEVVPSIWIPQFPHRSFNAAAGAGAHHVDQIGSPSNDGTQYSALLSNLSSESRIVFESQRRSRLANKYAPDARREAQRRALRDSVYLFLDRGDIQNAKRAFSLLLRAPTAAFKGRALDLRYDNYWSLGAEIIMRDGEVAARSSTTRDAQRRFGLAANTANVKRYFQALILRYPYTANRPHAFSALHLYPSLWGYEIYSVHAERSIAEEKVRRETAVWDSHGLLTDTATQYGDELDNQESLGDARSPNRHMQFRARRNLIRQQALDELLSIIKRMDHVMAEMPFSKSVHLLRLRGMASLYLGDLFVPEDTEFCDEMEDAQTLREKERLKAEEYFELMRAHLGLEASAAPAEDESYIANEEHHGRRLADNAVSSVLANRFHDSTEGRSHKHLNRRSTGREENMQNVERVASDGRLMELLSSLNMYTAD